MKTYPILYIFLFLLTGLFACVEDPDMPGGIKGAAIPEVVTGEYSNLMAASFDMEGKVTKINGAPIMYQGFIVGLQDNLTFETMTDSFRVSPGNASFSGKVRGLSGSTEYYVAAFATNAAGTSYGESKWLKTLSGLGEIRTLDPVNIKAESVVCGGNILDAGEGAISERGVFYSTSPLTASNTSKIKVTSTMNTDSFTCIVNNLERETLYYVQAYANTEDFGMFTGEQKTFTTTSGKAAIGAFEIQDIGYTTAMLHAEIVGEGEAPVTLWGFCYAIDTNLPTIDNDTILSGDGLGEFDEEISGLLPYTQYYVRAFAVNGYGVAYSEEVLTVVTLNDLPTVQLLSAELATGASVYVEGEVQSEGVTAVVETGICWAVGVTPNIDDHQKMALSTGLGTYSGTITGLRGGLTYHIRAYATNDAGTTYGNVIKTITTPVIFANAATFNDGSRIAGSAAYFMIQNEAYFLGGDEGASYTGKLWKFTPTNGFTGMGALDVESAWMSAVGVDQTVFVLGGIVNGQLVNSFYQYLPQNNLWSPLNIANPPTAVARAMGVLHAGSVYYIGGIRQGGSNRVASNEVWIFNPYSALWQQTAAFPEAQYGGIAFSHTGTLYSGLGYTSATTTTRTQVLRKSTDNGATWQIAKTFSEISGGIQAGVVHQDNLYMVDNSGFIWCYDLIAGTLQRKTQLAAANRTVHCMYSIGNLIYLGLGNNTNTLISYNPVWDNIQP